MPRLIANWERCESTLALIYNASIVYTQAYTLVRCCRTSQLGETKQHYKTYKVYCFIRWPPLSCTRKVLVKGFNLAQLAIFHPLLTGA